MNKTRESNQRILVVDDLQENIKVIGILLRNKGYLISIAQSGIQALKIIEQNPPDLILLDIIMPEMDGYEVCRRIKANESSKDIPVIFMTAKTSIEDKVKGLNLGAVDYITKPFQQEEVLARVNNHLQIRKLTLQLHETNETLEKRVKQRTNALDELNKKLRCEISDCMAAKKALRESEERYRSVFEAPADALVPNCARPTAGTVRAVSVRSE